MSGNHSIRGYLVQTLITVLDSLENISDISAVTLEPLEESEKVDILWEYKNGTTKVTQVKSTKNTFRYNDVKKWCSELEEGSPNSSQYELILVGHCQNKVLKSSQLGDVVIPTPKSLNMDSLMSEASNKLDLYYEKKGISKIRPSIRNILVGNLITSLELSSITGETLSSEHFEKNLLEWISQIQEHVSRNPLVNLTPSDILPNESTEHTLSRKILQLIGWNGLNENETIDFFEEGINEEREYKVNFSGNWSSNLKDLTRDLVLIKSRSDFEYPEDPFDQVKNEIQNFNRLYDNKFLPESLNAFDEKNQDTYSILLWLSTNVKEHSASIDLQNYIKDKHLDDRIIYKVLDNQAINFLVSAIVTAKNYRDELELKFLYPITEANVQPKDMKTRGLRMPPQYIVSGIIPFIKEDKDKISVLLFCKDEYNPDYLKKLIWLTIKLTNGLGNEFIIYFPDYDQAYANEVNETLRYFNNDEISQKIKIKKFEKINAEALLDYPLPSNLKNVISTNTLNEEKIKINPTFKDLLPYGDILKPFLKTDAVTANDLKYFLEKKGVYIKKANRNRLIDVMCTMLFSPKELEEFKAMIDIKERPLKSSPEFRKLTSPIEISEVLDKMPILQKAKILKDIDVKILGDLKFKRNKENDNEILLDITTENKDLTNQLSLNTSWGRIIISIKVDDDQNVLINTIKTATKNDKIIANRIIKENHKILEEKNIILNDSVKINFSQFDNNIDRVNFLLSFSEISSSTLFTDQDISSIKFKYDEKQDIPDNLENKTEHDLVTYFNGKNLAGLSELSDEEFKRILLLDEIIIEYKFSWSNISDAICKVKFNFSNAIYNSNLDGEFNSESKLIKTYQVKKINNIAMLEKKLSEEVEKLKMEKIKFYNLI